MNSATELNGIHIVTRDDYKIIISFSYSFIDLHILRLQHCAGRITSSGHTYMKNTHKCGLWKNKNTVYILHNSHCSTRMKIPNRGEVPNNYCGRTGVFIIIILYYVYRSTSAAVYTHHNKRNRVCAHVFLIIYYT